MYAQTQIELKVIKKALCLIYANTRIVITITVTKFITVLFASSVALFYRYTIKHSSIIKQQK